MAYRAPARLRIPRALLRDAGPVLAGFLAANLRELIASAVASARGAKTGAVELAEALRLHSGDPGLARAAAELREFAQPSRVADTGLIDAFAAVAARGMATEADRATRSSTLDRLVGWCTQSGRFSAAADVQELRVRDDRAEGGPRLLRSLVALTGFRAISRWKEGVTPELGAITAEILDLSATVTEEIPLDGLVRLVWSAVIRLRRANGDEAALDASTRFVELAKEWCAPNDPAHLPLIEKAIDEHISLLLALDRLGEAVDHSRQLVDRYLLLVVTLRADPRDAAIVLDRHAHLLDRAERPEEALASSERAIAIGAKAPDFPKLAGLLRFHSDRLLAVGRESEAIEAAVQAVEAGEEAGSPLETAFSLADLTGKLIGADRDEEAFGWSRRALRAWSELFNEGVGIAAANLAKEMMNRRVLMLRRGEGREALTSAKSAVALYQKAVHEGDTSLRPSLAECLLAVCADMEDSREGRDLLDYSFKAVAAYEELETEFPGHFAVELSVVLDLYARTLANAGRPVEALAPALRNLAACEERAAPAGDPADRRALAGAVATCALLLVTTGDVDAGLEHSARAVSLFTELATAEPEAHARTARRVFRNHANFLSTAGRFDEALVHVRCTLAESAALVAEDRVRNLGLLAEARDGEAYHLHLAGRTEEAVAAADGALRAWREAAELNPDMLPATAGAIAWHAEFRMELGDPVRAAELAEEAALSAVHTGRPMYTMDGQPRSLFTYSPEGLGSLRTETQPDPHPPRQEPQ